MRYGILERRTQTLIENMRICSSFENKKINELEKHFIMYGYECMGLLVKEYGENYEQIIELEWNMCLCDFIAEYWDDNYLGFNI